MNQEQIKELVQDLDSLNPARVYYAAKMLAEIRSNQALEAVPALVKALSCNLYSGLEQYIRCTVIQALKQIDAPEVIPSLVQALTDPHEWVQIEAQQALVTLGEPAAKFLGQILDNPHHTLPQINSDALKSILNRISLNKIFQIELATLKSS